VSLKKALEAVPEDRLTRITASVVVRYLHEHWHHHVDISRIVAATGQDEQRVCSVIEALLAGRVLDCVGDPPGYKFITDRVLRIEVDLYLRSSQGHAESMQSNVERYRRMYHGR